MSIYIVLQLENIVWYAITAISSRLMLYVVSDTEREFEINDNIKAKFLFLKQKNVLEQKNGLEFPTWKSPEFS